MQTLQVYKNGEYISESEVCISFRDLGFQRSFGVFDYFRTYNHKPFQLDWHAEQLFQSLDRMNISCSLRPDDFLKIISELFEKNKNHLDIQFEYGVKTLVTGGKDGLFLVYLEKLDLSEYIHLRTVGAGLLVHNSQRLYPEVKSLDYRTQYVCTDALAEKKCLEILYVHNNYVFESATSNIFFIKGGEIITPKESIYKGSTRDYVISFAREHGYRVHERAVSWIDCRDADEVFITASKKEILPITHIHMDDQVFNFPLGPITSLLIDIFQQKNKNL